MSTHSLTALLTWRHALLGSLGLAACGGAVEGASSNRPGTESGGGAGTAGSGGSGNVTANGGGAGTGTGGLSSGGVTSTGGIPSTGGIIASAGTAVGGFNSTGGTSTGGVTSTGGFAGQLAHRPVATQCEPFEPRPERQATIAADGGTPSIQCEFDADCTDGVNGYCSAGTYDFDATSYAYCSYGCVVDADCGQDQVCECSGIANRCVYATCGTDAACQGANLCLRTEFDDGCGVRVEYHCQTPMDTCASNADCADGLDCSFSVGDGRHMCQGYMCAVGRPFLVDAAPRLAEAIPSDTWAGEALPILRDVPLDRARVLTERWTEIGLMEHASIAAFARFSMQLLELGAPPTLLSAATEAMADETRHARMAFGFAAAFGGAPVGPGPLSMVRALSSRELADVLRDVVLEGCVGETIAAQEAEVGAHAAADPVVRDALATIAADERRHAELAWQFVRWVLDAHPELGEVALATAESELEQARALPSASRDDAWLDTHGIASEATRRAVRLQVLEHLVVPCMRALARQRRAA